MTDMTDAYLTDEWLTEYIDLTRRQAALDPDAPTPAQIANDLAVSLQQARKTVSRLTDEVVSMNAVVEAARCAAEDKRGMHWWVELDHALNALDAPKRPTSDEHGPYNSEGIPM